MDGRSIEGRSVYGGSDRRLRSARKDRSRQWKTSSPNEYPSRKVKQTLIACSNVSHVVVQPHISGSDLIERLLYSSPNEALRVRNTLRSSRVRFALGIVRRGGGGSDSEPHGCLRRRKSGVRVAEVP